MNILEKPFKLDIKREEPAKLTIAIIKYASKNNSNLLHSIFSLVLVSNFIRVKAKVNIANKPIKSDWTKTDKI